ncbi:SLC13 family permease [Propionivibrio dicarboxylicus]|uniref:Di-and tricarboxylate transporter n=1 Tax=Propionivibrio dicarboxylicus TaxID=83767 RepID=A0A1G8BFP8_9RHOO|nr:SLC13 family permease [Propionivibrio dicarboxylicus]SDH31843.1 Di-and tricarboxylate transporter [Propionivibrio dicarboxylicus]
MRSEFSAKHLFILVAVLAAVWVAFGPFAASVGARTAQCAAVVMVTLALWSTGVLPPFLTSLIFFSLVVVFGLARPDLIFSGFASTAVWLIVSGFVIGSAIGVSGLGQRLAAILAPLLAGSYAHMIAGLAISASLLGFLMPSSTGRAVVMLPIGMALAERVGFRPGSNGRIGIAVTLALACNMPSFAILPANIPNMILAGASETLHGISLSYASYLSLHFPLLGILKSALLIALVLLLFPDRLPDRLTECAEAQPKAADPAAKAGEPPVDAGAQRRVATILLVMLAFWMTDSLHGINAAWVGLVAAVCLLLPRVGVVAPKAFNTSVDFGIVLFVSAALGLGALVHDSGLGTLVGKGLRYVLPLEAGHAMLNFYSLSLMSMLTGLITTIPGVPTVLTPMAPELAAASGFSLTAVLMTQVVGFSTVIFPYQVGPLVVAMQLSGEKLGHVLRITIPLGVLSFALIVPLDFLWWRLLGWI